jgi:hypothetical protein
MRDLFGVPLAPDALHAYLGRMDQLAGVRPVRLTDGLADGLRALEVRTGSGLRFDVLAGRGMDIGSAEYRGIPLSWRSPTGDVAPEHFETQGLGWLRSFHGGLLVGCGLRWMGAQSTDEEEALGLHGRLSNTPAERVTVDEAWQEGEYRIVIRGVVHEARALRENLVLTRTIRTTAGEDAFDVEDEVVNHGFQPSPHMLLYHMNLGFPVVSEASRLIAPIRSVTPRDATAAAGLAAFDRFSPPDPSEPEHVFYLDLLTDDAGRCHVGIVRWEPQPLAVVISFLKREFPYFAEWQVCQPGTYAVGLEPATALVEGLAVERGKGRVQDIGPGETRHYRVRLEVLTAREQLQEFVDRVERIQAKGRRLVAGGDPRRHHGGTSELHG